MQSTLERAVRPGTRRTELLVAPMQPLAAADRLVSLSATVHAAAVANEQERVDALVDRFVNVVVAHLDEVGRSMWAETQGALWRTFHRALLGRGCDVVCAVIGGVGVRECAEDLAFVAERYRSAVARRPVAHDGRQT